MTCKSVEKDANGKVTVIHCEYDPQSKGGETPDGRKVKGTIHWVSAAHAVDAEVRLINNLFTLEDPAQVPEGEDWHDYLNPESMVIKQAKVELVTLTNYEAVVAEALRIGYIQEEEVKLLNDWRRDPAHWDGV